MAVKKLRYLLLFSIIYSCGTQVELLDAIKDEVDSVNIIPSSVNAISDELYTDPKNSKFIIEYGNVDTVSDPQILDSLFEVLKNEKKVLLELADKQLYLDLLSKYNSDTTYLANIYMKTPTDGVPYSYAYDVKKNDLIFFSVENLGNQKVEEVSIVEGSTYRYVKQEFPRKSNEKGVIKILDDNSLTLNIDNDNFFKNKGFFNSKLKIQLKKISPLKINYEVVTDSILETASVIETVYDTIYIANFKESLKLPPSLDITQRNEIVIPVDIEQSENQLVGWGYWIGLNKFNSILWNTDDDNDLVKIARQELFGIDEELLLQDSENDNILLRINDLSLDTRTLNYSYNYAFYKGDTQINKSGRRAELILKNMSNIYEYKIQVGMISVFLKKRQVEVDKDIFVTKEFIKLTLNDDE